MPALELGEGRAAGAAEGRLAVAEPGALGFGVLLRQLRDEAGLTQDELAEAAHVSQRGISDLERGVNRTARKDTAVLLADALSLAGPSREMFLQAARGRVPTARAPVSATGPHRESRRTVTALVCDFGVSSVEGTLDAEVRRRVLGRCVEATTPVLASFGGAVETFVGDLMLAVFGIPAVHEDDAVRAARAAAEVRRALQPLQGELRSHWGATLSPRFGISTGEVLTSDGTAGSVLLSGAVADAASSLREVAGTDEILIGEATWELARGAVQAERVSRPPLPGLERSAAAWRMIDISDSSPAISRRRDTPFFGRTEELDQLRAAYERACSEMVPRMVTVLGDPGMGKSRLADEARRSLFADAQVLVGRCHPYGEGATFAALREIVSQLLDGGEPETLSVQVADERDGVRVAEMVGALLGLGPMSARLDEGFWAVRRLCEALSRRRPLVLILEDVHWADATMLDLIEYVAEMACEAPLFLLCLARPELLEGHPRWGGRAGGTIIILEPLTAADTSALADWLARDAGSAYRISAQVVEASQGNPLFAEQLVAMLAEGNSPGDEPPLPRTVNAVIAARLEFLDPAEQLALQYASALGERFAAAPVAALVPPEVHAALDQHLRALVQKQFLRPARLPGGHDGFRFRHVLVRAAAYRRLPKDQRADIHERYAEFLGPLPAGEVSTEQAELLGHHFERAHAYRSQLSSDDAHVSYLADRAAGYLAAAGAAAFARADWRAADQFLGRAIALMAANDARRPALLYDRGTSLMSLGRMAEADSVLTLAIRAGELADDLPSQWRARLDHAVVRSAIDPPGVSLLRNERLAREAIRVLKLCNDNRGIARAWIVLGQIEEMRGQARRQERVAAQILKFAHLGGTYREVAWGRYCLAAAILVGPTPVKAGVARCEELVARDELRIGDIGLLSSSALLRAMQGQFDLGRQLIAEVRDFVEHVGHKNPLVGVMCVRGELELLAADPAAAETVLRQAHLLAAETGSATYRAESARLLARAMLWQGRVAQAQEFAGLVRGFAPPESLPEQARWRSIQSAIDAVRGESDEAVALATAADKILRSTDLLTLRAEVLTDLATALAVRGDDAKASEAARLATEFYEHKGDIIRADRTRRAFAIPPPS